MFRALLKLVVLLVVLVGAAAFFLGYWGGGKIRTVDGPDVSIGTAGRVSAEKAKEVGAELGARTAEAANRASAVLSEGAITAKIKSKMALDDLVQARSIDVTTSGQVVTLSGQVRSAAERDRAVQLAKETAGVTQVVDKLTVPR